MCADNQLTDLLLRSGELFTNLKFPNTIPNSPNALMMYKWYKQEVVFASDQLDFLEQSCAHQNACEKGCSGCCNQLIAISDVELLALKTPLQNLSVAERKTLKCNTLKICNVLTDNGIALNSPMATKSKTSEQELQEKYFNLNLPCPLLNDQQECSFYEVRPSACWFYRCYGNPTDCSESWNYPSSINYDLLSSLVMRRLYTAKKPTKRGLMILPFALLELL